MNTFTLQLQSATQFERIEGVASFVGEDASGAFGILTGHARMLTALVFGLARYRVGADPWTFLAQTTYIGTLGLLFIVPVAGGAYLGVWLDGLAEGYSVRWTVGLLLLGVIVGAFNVYLFIRNQGTD